MLGRILQGGLGFVDQAIARVLFRIRLRRDFVILSHARTGSNLLVELLNSHPNLICHGELFAPNCIFYRGKYYLINKRSSFLLWFRDQFPFACLNLFRLLPWDRRMIGFKLFEDQSSRIRRFLLFRKETKKIILLRRNFLRSELSLQIARVTENWVQFSEERKRIRIEFNVAEFWKNMSKIRDYQDSIRTSLAESGQRYAELYYEDISGDLLKRKMEGLLTFLGLPEYDFDLKNVSVKKQNPFSLKELVTNYDEIEESLVGTECEWMLKDA